MRDEIIVRALSRLLPAALHPFLAVQDRHIRFLQLTLEQGHNLRVRPSPVVLGHKHKQKATPISVSCHVPHRGGQSDNAADIVFCGSGGSRGQRAIDF